MAPSLGESGSSTWSRRRTSQYLHASASNFARSSGADNLKRSAATFFTQAAHVVTESLSLTGGSLSKSLNGANSSANSRSAFSVLSGDILRKRRASERTVSGQKIGISGWFGTMLLRIMAEASDRPMVLELSVKILRKSRVQRRSSSCSGYGVRL